MTGNAENSQVDLNSDAPKTNPVDDCFGYAGFAKMIASAIQRTPSPQGLVMAIHGPWGSGKSSLLNFVKHNLSQAPSDEQVVTIDFNPWWFNDKDHLATQFLSQFSAKFENKTLRDIGDKIATYADSLGKTVAIGYGIPWLDRPITWIFKRLGRKKQEVAAAKKEISRALRQGGKRYLFVIDDIDRLTPEEIRELFKVVKALADFPNVIYLLSFDRQVVENALKISLGVDGEAYLEKIVQIPFSLPSVDELRLRQKFTSDLDRVLNQFPVPEFDQTYWGNVFLDGLAHFLKKPRDIVRIINAVTVTYPAAAGEVNAVDYVALEFLRVFEPMAYHTIRENKDMFAGGTSLRNRGERDPLGTFHEAWIEKISEPNRGPVKELVSHLFPRAAQVWGGMGYQGEWLGIWRKSLRACSPDLFDVYFQFGVSPDLLSRADLMSLITAAPSTNAVIEILNAAAAIVRPDGHSKARDYIDRLRDLKDELTPEVAKCLLSALFEVGDRLLIPGDMGGAVFSIPNRWRLEGLADHLFARINMEERDALMLSLASSGNALGLIVGVIDKIQHFLDKPDEDHRTSFKDLDLAALSENLKTILIDRLKQVPGTTFLEWPEMAFILHRWGRWGNSDDVRQKVAELIDSPNTLSLLLERYTSIGSVQGMGDRVARRTINLNPKTLEAFVDLSVLEPKVHGLLASTELTDDQLTAAKSFIKNMGRIRAGQDPSGWHDEND